MSTDRHAELHTAFRWRVPVRFNIAEACLERWARRADAGARIAIRTHDAGGLHRPHSYADLYTAAISRASQLRALGVRPGDRVAIVMPQRFETAVAYMAVLRLGAIAVPLSMLFGPDALGFRLADSGAVAALCDPAAVDGVRSVQGDAPSLAHVIDAIAEWPAASDPFDIVSTAADEAAVLIYTSGTTGPPKGALVPHRALIGNLPGFICSQNGFHTALTGEVGAPLPREDRASGLQEMSVFWSPADWAWTGGLMDALLPTLYFGRTIVACSERFSAESAFEVMQQHRVTHTFLFPTALKAMMKAVPEPRARYDLKLEAVMSAGEAVGSAVFDYTERQLGVRLNEMFGQTEINYVVGNCAGGVSADGEGAAPAGWPPRAGSMGKPYPGHRVAVIDDDGAECPPGVAGEIAVARHDVHGDADPVFFLGYWNQPEATRAKFAGEWCRTGDLAVRDEDGYFWYRGRADDLFKVAGYRVGPGEIENCLVSHPAVANAAVVPKPDGDRGSVVKAFVVIAPDFIASEVHYSWADEGFRSKLTKMLQDHVRARLAPYEYPKEIEYVESLPMTTTGKVQRRVLRELEIARSRGGEV